MSFTKFEHAISELKGITEYVYFHLMGEPLCHPSLPDYIRHATSRGFKCAITTNGSLLKKRGGELLESGVYKMNISLHSFEGDSAELKKAYLNECLEFAEKASDRGILVVLRLWNGGDCKENEMTLDAIRAYFPNEEWLSGARGIRIKNKLHIEYGERFEWPDINRENMGDKLFCYGLADHFGILVDGTVVPCCLDSDGVISLGNVFKEKLSDILSSHRAAKIRDGFKNKCATEALCKRCGYARRFKV